MRSRARCRLVVRPPVALMLASLATLAVACSTVDLGDPPADINACRPSQRFFVENVWPNYLTKSYGGKTCADTSCHGSGTVGNALQIPPPTSTATFPLLAGSDWFAAYLSASREMTCTDVMGSPLYEQPSGLSAGHGGGALFSPGGPELTLLQQWVTPGP